MKPNKMRAYDIFGNIALVKFQRGTGANEKRRFAQRIISGNKAIKTVLEKSGKFKGRLRKQETKWIAGEKTKEVLYHENGCVFRFNIDKTYFSPRLSNERKEIAGKIKKGSEVLVMFAGVGPYPIVIAKNSDAKIIYSNEINKEANKYAQMNIEMNKMKNRVVLYEGDIKKVVPKTKQKYDYIVMPRPQLRESFLKEAFYLSKKGTIIFYYDFCKEDEKQKIIDKIQNEAKQSRKKIKILRIKNAGEIAPYKMRVRVDFKVL
jgi:tRNA (guanine37-N1)-methyltransferase